MKKQSAPKEKNSLKIVVLFVIAVAILVFTSLLIKTIFMIRVSKFDGTHQFTVFIEQKSDLIEVVSFDPASPALSLVRLEGQSLSAAQAGSELGLLSDSVVSLPDDLQLDQNSSNGMKTLLWNYERIHTNLTFYDVLRLYFLAKGTTLSNKHIASIHLPSDATAIDKVVSSSFMDSVVSQENVSIQVINASGVPGMANRLARVITNMGGNVVSVTTAQMLQKHSSIAHFGSSSYTLQKFAHLLSYPVSTLQNETIADIVITIGEDSSKTTKF